MVTYYVEKDEIYKVSATVNCAVYDASGSTIATCDAGSIVTFKAPTDKILISDNNAALNCISETSGDLSGFTEHVNNSSIHVTATEKANWNSALNSIATDNAEFKAHMVDTTIHITEEKVASMLNEELYTQGEYRTTYGSDNFNAHAFEITEPPIGEISQIALPCRSASGNVASMYVDGPVYLSIFEKDASGIWRHIGTSTNSNTQTVSTTAYYQFDNLTLSGRAIRVIIVTDNTSTDFDASRVIGARVTAVPDKGFAYMNANLSATQEYMIDLTFVGENVEAKYAPISHVGDDTHISSDERAMLVAASGDIQAHTLDEYIHVTAEDRKNILICNLPGKIEHYAGYTVPEGYLLCDGSEVSRTDYAALFEAIGTTWGEGDGSTTFALPNLIDRVIWGASTAGEYLEAGLPNITGNVSFKDNSTSDIYATVSNTSGAITSYPSDSSKTMGIYNSSLGVANALNVATLDASLSSSIYGKSTTVQPPAAKLIPIIKY